LVVSDVLTAELFGLEAGDIERQRFDRPTDSALQLLSGFVEVAIIRNTDEDAWAHGCIPSVPAVCANSRRGA
jgi:hypothetical protein